MSNNSRNAICALIGCIPSQRPSDPAQHVHFFRALKNALKTALCQAIAEGFSVFCAGGDTDFDLWVTEAMLPLKAAHPHIRLYFLLPCETKVSGWLEAWRERYFNTPAQADEVACIPTGPAANCAPRRNHALVDAAQLLIVCHNGNMAGSTADTLRYAAKRAVPVRNIYSAAIHALVRCREGEG